MGLGGGGPLPWLGMAGADQEFVDFGTRTKAFLDPVTQAREAGTLTFDQVQQAQAQLEEEYDAYKFKLDSGSLSGDPKVTEGFRTASGSYVDKWRNTLKLDAEKLGPKLELPAPPTLESILAGVGQTPKGQATSAASRVRKSLTPSSILTGYKPTTGTTTRTTTAVGY